LGKYDEEISGPKKGTSFELGARGSYNTTQERRLQDIKDELQRERQSLGESLNVPKTIIPIKQLIQPTLNKTVARLY